MVSAPLSVSLSFNVIFYICSVLLILFLKESVKLVSIFMCLVLIYITMFMSDPVTRGLSIVVNWLGIQVDVSIGKHLIKH